MLSNCLAVHWFTTVSSLSTFPSYLLLFRTSYKKRPRQSLNSLCRWGVSWIPSSSCLHLSSTSVIGTCQQAQPISHSQAHKTLETLPSCHWGIIILICISSCEIANIFHALKNMACLYLWLPIHEFVESHLNLFSISMYPTQRWSHEHWIPI